MKKIAVLGPEGTFSHNAAIEYMKNNLNDFEIDFFNSIDETLFFAEKNCDFAIVPIENTLDGYVQRTLDLLLELNLTIIDEIVIPVKFSFVSNVKNLNELKSIYVQFKANGQCRKFINSLNKSIITTQSNMESFYRLKESPIGFGAIVPFHIISKIFTETYIENVTDSDNNFTRFIVLSNKTLNVKIKERIKIPLFIMPNEDKPGTLFNILKIFYQNNINLVSIISRPTRKKMGTYNFYIEIDGDSKDKNLILGAINKLEKEYDIKLLGIYSP